MKFGTSRVLGPRRQVDLDLEPVAEAHRLDVEIGVDRVDLVRQGHVLDRIGVERGAEEIGQVLDHILGLRACGRVVTRPEIEFKRVEQEMGIELEAQRGGDGIGGLRFGARGTGGILLRRPHRAEQGQRQAEGPDIAEADGQQTLQIDVERPFLPDRETDSRRATRIQ